MGSRLRTTDGPLCPRSGRTVHGMKKAAKVTATTVASVLALLAVAVVGLYFWATNEYTECYAIYGTKHAAERSEATWRDAGFDVSIERRDGWGAVVTEGSTDEEPQKKFRRVLHETNGESGHGTEEEGCIVRSPLH